MVFMSDIPKGFGTGTNSVKYNLSDPKEVIAARSRLTYLVTKKRRVDLTEVRRDRTLNQNSYLHLLIADFAVEFGYNLAEAKIVYKRCSPDLYVYRKHDQTFVKSSADLSLTEMAQSITRFKDFSREQGHDLPEAENAEWRSLIENNIEKNRRYL
jgi:hypothetical protein